MKILYVITGLAQGGAERVVCDLADKMYEKGYEVKIAYLTGNVLTHPSHEEIELIKVNLNNIGTLVPAYIKLAKIVRDYQPDVVHAHMVHANLLSRLVRLISPIDRLITTAHNSNEGGRARMILYRATHRLADTTTNVSKEAVLAFENIGAVPKGGMKHIYNGINLDKFQFSKNSRSNLYKELSLSENYKIILAVGRFNDQKDYPSLLKAIGLFKKEGSFPFKLIIAGDGELRTTLEQKIKELNLEQDVILLGRRNDIPELISAADLFVLSSKYEGFGLVVAEAMACECLVVATDSGGVAEVLNNSEFLVPPCDPLALSNKIYYALSINKKLKESIIKKNMQHVHKSFSLDNIINEWIFLYNEK
ncbi:glycosyltransferase involved in cell wall biosynthesis [Psychrobacter sp. PL19]|uniref:glycosyltransferase n=1 Tax=Psychrobacter sp. PL19 TaxID=2760711 RepID=UPI001AE2400B